MVRLFRAWSVLDEFLGQDQVIFNWFVAGRPAPILPYEELIDNFDEGQEESWYDKMLVNELLTEAEVEELREYLLDTHKVEIQVEEVMLPVQAGGLSYGLLLISGEKGFYTLAEEEEYKLSVSILGHYELDEKNLPGLLSYEELQLGISFLTKVFESLDISIEQNEQIALLNKIYEETGLLVRKDKKKAERMSVRKLNN